MQVIPQRIDLATLPPFDPDSRRARRDPRFDPARRLVAQVGGSSRKRTIRRTSPRRRAWRPR
jgi:hypothetical protein